MTHAEQSVVGADHTQARRATILFTLRVMAITLVATLAAGWIVGNRTQREVTRADNALAALAQACDEVVRLGGHCAAPPSQIPPARPGEPGPAGPPGRAPTQAEITAAVAAYLAEHPPPVTLVQGSPTKPVAASCPLLGYHLQVATFRLVGGDTKSLTILACVPD